MATSTKSVLDRYYVEVQKLDAAKLTKKFEELGQEIAWRKATMKKIRDCKNGYTPSSVNVTADNRWSSFDN